MRFTKLTHLFLAALVCLGQQPAQSQENDPLSEVRQYPPHMISREGSDLALASIKWRLEQLRSLLDQTEQRMVRLENEENAYLHAINDLTSKLPSEIRFVDDAVRSRLVGKAMEELLSARLDVATQQKSVSLFEEQLETTARSEVRKLQAAEHELRSRASRVKLGLATERYDNARKLVEKGIMTSNELVNAKLDIETARFEVEAADLQLQIALKEKDTEIAQKLTAARIDVEPMKARIAAAEEFLGMFAASAEINSAIQQRKRKIEGLRENQQEMSREALRVGRTMIELRVLSRGLQNAIDKMDKDKADRPVVDDDPKK